MLYTDRAYCYHYYNGPLYGDVSWITPVLQEAIRTGKLVNRGKYGGICDHKVPLMATLFNGQDISCDGPDSPHCPDRGAQVMIPISAIIWEALPLNKE